MDAAFLIGRITVTKALIIAYEEAILQISTGAVQSYTLDTGQSVQTVTKLNLNTLNESLGGLYNRCATMEARLNGSGTTMVVPSW